MGVGSETRPGATWRLGCDNMAGYGDGPTPMVNTQGSLFVKVPLIRVGSRGLLTCWLSHKGSLMYRLSSSFFNLVFKLNCYSHYRRPSINLGIFHGSHVEFACRLSVVRAPT